MQDFVSDNIGRNGADNGFNFRKFRHGFLWKVDVDASVSHNNGIALQLDAWIEVVDACFAIECPGMPGADDLIAVQIAVSQRAARVRTQAIEAADCTVVMAQRIGVPVDLDLR